MLSLKEQYEHPFWRKKSNGILERDNYECRCCHSGVTQLHAHHLYYEKGLHVWEYDDDALVTLCKHCHRQVSPFLSKLAGMIAFEILIGKIDATDFLNRIKQDYNYGGK